MIITDITTFPLRIPFAPGTESADAAWGPKGLKAVDSLLVRVTTDEGTVGWGESFGFTGVPITREAIDGAVAPACVGQDPLQIVPLMHEVQRKLHVFGRAGPLMHGLSAVDIALWDIAGKVTGAPVHQLLGGSGHADLPCYASLDAYADPELVRAAVRRAADSGFVGVKLHEKGFPEISAARDEAGPDLALMVDVNCAWSPHEASAIAGTLRPLALTWLEEPVWPPENFAGLAQVRRAGVPIAAGENVSTLLGFQRLLDSSAVDFVQPSPAKAGGVTELCKVFTVAALHNIPVMPHTFYDGPGLLAALHAAAVLATPETMIEWRYFDLEAQIYGGALTVRDGRVRVPLGPGLGLEPDPDVISTYLIR
ncbi:mandelate racemase/muconate lactonizing enzyme family protein [Streptomyces sp. NBC_01341]|uniref:mandelate racemase/muconate lactonizing enzyme family protein n=1 Tax=Streptomyces sp. NBC_01341 TaxID=2903831 RepID=UPI002E149870|nr:mandelate racemase/muconate lactonizing enzyme family protein [Streptomyces sp. NBC_01341]